MEDQDIKLDALQELINIGVGRAAASLSSMTGERVGLRAPAIRFCKCTEAAENLPESPGGALSAVQQRFEGVSRGEAILIFPPESAANLVALLLGEVASGANLCADREAVITEIGNIVINGVMGTFGNLVDGDLHYKVPNYMDTSCDQLAESWSEVSANFLSIDVSFDVASHAIRGTLQLLFELNEQHDPMVLLDRVVPSVR